MSDVVLMTRSEVATMLRCHPRTLARGWGPQPLRHDGGRVLYDRRDVLAWIESCRQTSTSDAPVAQKRGRRAGTSGTIASSTEETSIVDQRARQIVAELREQLAKSVQKQKPTRRGQRRGAVA